MQQPTFTPTQGSGQPSPPALLKVYRQWAEWLKERAGCLPGFEHVARTVLVAALRRHYPYGSFQARFLDDLMVLQIRRLLNGVPLETAPLEDDGLDFTVLAPEQDERDRVVVEVTEATAPGLIEDYKAAVHKHLTGSLQGVPHAATLQQKLALPVGRWAAEVEGFFSDERHASVADTLEHMASAEARLMDGLTLEALLTDEENLRLRHLAREFLPHWLRFAAVEDQAELQRLADRALTLEQELRTAGEHLEDPMAYLLACASAYTAQASGVFVDASKVKVETVRRTEYGNLRQVCSLADLLVAGPYSVDSHVQRRVIDLPEGVTPVTVPLTELLHTFDARAQYAQALAGFDEAQHVRSLRLDHLDAVLVHSAMAARLRGHLGKDSHEAVLAARTDEALPAGSVAVATLALPSIGSLGLLLFNNPDQGAVNPWVLYAPGKYDGQEWIELSSVRAVTQEIGGWAREEPGRLYLLGRLPHSSRSQAERLLVDTMLKPTHWAANEDYRCGNVGYQQGLAALMALQVANRAESVAQAFAPRWYVQQPLPVRQNVNDLTERLKALHAFMVEGKINPEPFVDFAQRTVRDAITPYLASKGITEAVDPDTIVFDYIPAPVIDWAPQGVPKPVSATLMDLAVTGYDDNWGLDNPHMPVRSSIGQDLSGVRAADLAGYLRSAYLGDKYCLWLRTHVLDDDLQKGGWRGEVYARTVALKAERDALVALLMGHLSRHQYQQVGRLLVALAAPRGGLAGAVRRATVDGVALRQVYVMRLSSGERLVYCPDAPDGVTFQPHEMAFSEYLSAQMQLFYQKRVPVAMHARVRARLADMALGRAVRDAAEAGDPVKGWAEEFVALAKGLMADVKHITKGRRDVITEQVLKGLGFASVPLGVLLPPVGFLLDAALAAFEAYRGVQALRAGDSAAAAGFFAGAYLSGLSLLVPVGYLHLSNVRQISGIATHYAGVYRSAGARGALTIKPSALGVRPGATQYIGALDDIAEVFPDRRLADLGRVALAGEGLGAGFDPAKLDNYLVGVETRGSVVTTLYNPATQRGVVLNIDHGVADVIDETLDAALKTLGETSGEGGLQAVTVGGDWLSVPGNILEQVNHALGVRGVLTRPDHWLPGYGASGVKGVLLDLKTGSLLVWRFTSQGRRAFYDPLREYPIFADEQIRSRAQRFWSRLKAGRWEMAPGGGHMVDEAGEVLDGAAQALRIPIHKIDS